MLCSFGKCLLLTGLGGVANIISYVKLLAFNNFLLPANAPTFVSNE